MIYISFPLGFTISLGDLVLVLFVFTFYCFLFVFFLLTGDKDACYVFLRDVIITFIAGIDFSPPLTDLLREGLLFLYDVVDEYFVDFFPMGFRL
jgi:hypothetical protein